MSFVLVKFIQREMMSFLSLVYDTMTPIFAGASTVIFSIVQSQVEIVDASLDGNLMIFNNIEHS